MPSAMSPQCVAYGCREALPVAPEFRRGGRLTHDIRHDHDSAPKRAVRHSETLSGVGRYRLPGTGVQALSGAHTAFKRNRHRGRHASVPECPPKWGYRPARDPAKITRPPAHTHKMRDPHENTPIRETRPETRLRARAKLRVCISHSQPRT